jgi:hypothetical protein
MHKGTGKPFSSLRCNKTRDLFFEIAARIHLENYKTAGNGASGVMVVSMPEVSF